ncbi:unnamed protein product [Oppiella nova]|uniref:Uncharacterized protein n=1 Tax=Oppiella nova TaxID=334625 RepID=A0A7R9QBL8_9ACAR|nr:unnamed protein product [Oppiella nova]CAG2161636.1 unnamed protein product [Oppiella nova]
MGVTVSQVLFLMTIPTMIALGVGYVVMPSDDQKKKYWNQKYADKQSFTQKTVDNNDQFMDVIRKSASSDTLVFGRKSKPTDSASK